MNAFPYRRKIDLVDFDGLKLFMFVEDNLYRIAVAENRKHQDLAAYMRRVHQNGYPASLVTPQNAAAITSAKHGVFLFLHHLWQNDVDFTVLDLGSFIGDFSIKVGNFIRTCGRTTKVISFDPTEAGMLVDFNIRLNGLQDLVRHENMGIAEYDGPLMFSYRIGQADSTAISAAGKASTLWQKALAFLRMSPRAMFSTAQYAVGLALTSRESMATYNLVCEGVNIVKYLERANITTNLLVKIDIEGGDAAIVKELLVLQEKRLISIIMEFTPGRYESEQASRQFLTEMSERFYLFDLAYCPNPTRFAALEPSCLGGFVTEIAHRRRYGYTDVLMVDKRIPKMTELVTRLGSLHAEADIIVL